MKNILALLLIVLAVAGCSAGHGPSFEGVRAQGGVDVGNAPAAIVPQTKVAVNYPSNWQPSVRSDVLYLENESGSSIEARKSEITDLSSPNALSLQLYLKAKFPDRNYKQIHINGLEGVRAELVDTVSEKSSDLYLVSEQGDFLHMRSYLKDVTDGFSDGEGILSSVRVLYKGVALPVVAAKTVTLESKSGVDPAHDRHVYAFMGDCFRFSDPNCNPWGGVGVSAGRTFNIGAAGSENGRIVELGPESQIPFDSIRVDGKYLVAPRSNILISDIYSAFSAADHQVDRGGMELKAGYTYLVRTINWPSEDLITKMAVVSVSADQTVIKYQKLVAVDKESLQSEVEAINKNTLENEMPISEGEVTLYDRSYWRNYFYASFNYEYSTSGNPFITKNNWDLEVDSACTGNLMLSIPQAGSQLSQMVDLGARDLATVTDSDFKTPTDAQHDCGFEAKVGHVFTSYRIDQITGANVLGAVQVLEIGPQNKWARFRFRRIKVIHGKDARVADDQLG